MIEIHRLQREERIVNFISQGAKYLQLHHQPRMLLEFSSKTILALWYNVGGSSYIAKRGGVGRICSPIFQPIENLANNFGTDVLGPLKGHTSARQEMLPIHLAFIAARLYPFSFKCGHHRGQAPPLPQFPDQRPVRALPSVSKVRYYCKSFRNVAYKTQCVLMNIHTQLIKL